MEKKVTAFQRVTPSKNLTDALISQIRELILNGKLALSQQLPTEQEMMAMFGVSRTVVREAVAALRSEGLVVTRQGLGAFVASSLDNRPFAIDPDIMSSITEALHILELRMTVEVEAAALAAERRTKQDINEITKTLTAIERAIEAGEAAVEPDFQFHAAVAKATKNPYFSKFLEFLGRFIIPRYLVGFSKAESKVMHNYLERVQTEHRDIVNAIKAGDRDAARKAMRIHLTHGRERYRNLRSAVKDTPAKTRRPL